MNRRNLKRKHRLTMDKIDEAIDAVNAQPHYVYLLESHPWAPLQEVLWNRDDRERYVSIEELCEVAESFGLRMFDEQNKPLRITREQVGL